MFKLRYCVFVLLFVVSLSYSALAQAVPKSVLINTSTFFDEKTGITRLVAAQKQLETEFSGRIKALQADTDKVRAIATELQNYQKQTLTPAIQSAMAAKQDEGQNLQRRIEFNKTELEADMNKRREALVGPITFDVGKAIGEFGKKNGYGAIYDATKLSESGALLYVGDGSEITKDFIAFYKARSAAVPVK